MLRSGCVLVIVSLIHFVAQGQQNNATIAAIQSLIRSQKYDEALEATKARLTSNASRFPALDFRGNRILHQGS
jgi:hypothetical protein